MLEKIGQFLGTISIVVSAESLFPLVDPHHFLISQGAIFVCLALIYAVRYLTRYAVAYVLSLDEGDALPFMPILAVVSSTLVAMLIQVLFQQYVPGFPNTLLVLKWMLFLSFISGIVIQLGCGSSQEV
jgi:ABC-type Fe3+-siderophore transport system permease subunit